MIKENLKIVFYTNTSLSILTLNALLLDGYDVGLIITTTTLEELGFVRLKRLALDYGSKIIRVKSPKDPKLKKVLEEEKPNLGIVLSYDILPEEIYTFPKLGTFNIHASLLPDYRGPEPTRWAIINGETRTGLTSHWIDSGIDTGKIIRQTTIPINEKIDNRSFLSDLFYTKIPTFCIDTVKKIIEEGGKGVYQKLTGKEKKAPRVTEADTWIDWDNTADNIENFILGMSPNPGAKAIVLGIECKIISATIEKRLVLGKGIGESVIVGSKVYVNTRDYWMRIDTIEDNEKRGPILGESFVKRLKKKK